VLWVGLEGDLAKLHQLQQALTEGLQRHGFPTEERAFSPHITLARRRDRAESSLPPAWPPPRQPHAHSAPLERLTLFQSELSRVGARYTPLAQFEIGGRH
jgi:2'-5' RNA ligase